MKNLILTTLVIGCLAVQGQAKTYQFEGVQIEVPDFVIKTGYVELDPPKSPTPPKPYKDIDWVEIKGKTFWMGTSDAGYSNATPFAATVTKFKIAKTEVTAEQFAKCLKEGKCSANTLGEGSLCNLDKQTQAPKPGLAKHPMNCVNHEGAGQFSASVGGRLPTEAEWELAATGGNSQRYPWGNEAPSCKRAVMHEGGDGCKTGGTMEVAEKPAGANGLFDMSGNVWEWTADWYGDYPKFAMENPKGPAAGSNRVIRGGSFYNFDARNLRADLREGVVPGYRYDFVGFRPVRD